MISNCLNGGSIIAGSSYTSAFDNIDGVAANSQNFSTTLTNNNFTSTSVNRIIELSNGIITDVQNNKYIDLSTTSNSAALDHLSRLAAKSYSTTGCNTANLNADSWIPSASQSVVSCASGISAAGNCSDLSNAGCTRGCRGFTQQFGTSTNNQCGTYNCTASGSASTQLNAIYGGCNYNTLINNLNANYDSTRQTALATLKTNLNAAGTGGLDAITNYYNQIQALIV